MRSEARRARYGREARRGEAARGEARQGEPRRGRGSSRDARAIRRDARRGEARAGRGNARRGEGRGVRREARDPSCEPRGEPRGAGGHGRVSPEYRPACAAFHNGAERTTWARLRESSDVVATACGDLGGRWWQVGRRAGRACRGRGGGEHRDHGTESASGRRQRAGGERAVGRERAAALDERATGCGRRVNSGSERWRRRRRRAAGGAQKLSHRPPPALARLQVHRDRGRRRSHRAFAQRRLGGRLRRQHRGPVRHPGAGARGELRRRRGRGLPDAGGQRPHGAPSQRRPRRGLRLRSCCQGVRGPGDAWDAPVGVGGGRSVLQPVLRSTPFARDMPPPAPHAGRA